MKTAWAAAAMLLAVSMQAEEKPGRIFRHPDGLEFTYPGAWQVRSAQDSVQLVPDDAMADAKGEPLEMLLFAGESAGGVTSVNDPRVAAYLETQLRQWLPKLERLPESRSAANGLGPGAAFRFKGANAAQTELQVETYVVLEGDSAILLIHAGPPSIFAKRQKQASAVFASLTRGKPSMDAAVVAVWRRSTYIRSGPSIGSPGSLSASTWYYLRFHPDGTVEHAVRDRMFGNTSDLGVILNKDSGKTEKGRWRTAAGVLHMEWEGGSSESYSYLVESRPNEGTTLRLLRPNGNAKPLYYHQLTP